MNLEMTAELRKRLAEMQQQGGFASASEVVRFSLALYEELLEHDKEGGKIVLRNSDGTDETLRLIFVR